MIPKDFLRALTATPLAKEFHLRSSLSMDFVFLCAPEKFGILTLYKIVQLCKISRNLVQSFEKSLNWDVHHFRVQF